LIRNGNEKDTVHTALIASTMM